MAAVRRAAVIGAGPAGLATTKALLDAGVEVVTYERSARAGGLWARDSEGGRSPAYASLHLNTSKGRTEFADLPMPDSWPDYPSVDQVGAYLDTYVETFGLLPHLRLSTVVTAVERHDEGGWQVTTEHGSTSRYDGVVVANGHNWDPRWPEPGYPGSFTGTQMHAHEYRDPEVFRGKGVLVVGMGNSAMDIAVDAAGVARRPVLLSSRHGVHVVPKYLFGRPSDATAGAMARLPWRLRQRLAQTLLRVAVGEPQRYGLPAPRGGLFQSHPTISDTILHRLTHGDVVPRVGIDHLDGDGVAFTDGTRDTVDVVVWATGYRVTIPFLAPRWLGADAADLPLYKRVFHLEAPGLAFVGLMQSTGSALPVVEAQAKLVAAHVSGSYALPSPADQQRAVTRALRAATDRWGADGRPMMRIDVDAYCADLPREIRAGQARMRRSTGVPFAPFARQESAV